MTNVRKQSPCVPTSVDGLLDNSRPLGGCWRSRNVAFQQQLDSLVRFAQNKEIPILLEGPSGSGKTRIARETHALSPRCKEPFREVALSSLEDSLASSDLFGHVAGAYTDARHTRIGAFLSAPGGTLFLDEIGKASEKVQLKLLGSVERKIITQQGSDREVRVNVRIISATNVAMAELVRTGKFLPDLAARLGLFRVVMPPLRERREDIPDLVQEIVAQRAVNFGYEQIPTIDADLLLALERADWPLNIRELDATLQRLLLEAAENMTMVLTFKHCVGDLDYLVRLGEPRRTRDISQVDVQRETHTTESRASLARRLGISQATLYRRLRGPDERSRDD